jgi:hypothetical protein|tara:strand:- start:267 stop:431 length:165 start_codon:yes stop_codon:yes gene_type:complete
MSNLDDMEMRKDELEQKYEWFLEECLDKKELIMRIVKDDPIGEKDTEFEDYKTL